jgi:hypothetical protein
VTAVPKLERHEPGPVDEEGVRLPGQNRYLPSEDPRNRPQETSAAVPVPNEAPNPVKAEAPRSPAPKTPAPLPDSVRTVAPAPWRVFEGTKYRVQVFASSIPQKARSIRNEIASKTKEQVTVEQEGGVWKVRVGEPMGRAEASALRGRMNGLGYHDAFVLEVHPQ